MPVVTSDKFARFYHAADQCRRDHRGRQGEYTQHRPDAFARQRVRHSAPVAAKVAPEHDILCESERHPDRRRPESVVKPETRLQQARGQRPDESSQVDTEIKQREAAVGPCIAPVVEGA
jgi:hypothetical protein